MNSKAATAILLTRRNPILHSSSRYNKFSTQKAKREGSKWIQIRNIPRFSTLNDLLRGVQTHIRNFAPETQPQTQHNQDTITADDNNNIDNATEACNDNPQLLEARHMMSKYNQNHIGWYLRFDSHDTAQRVMSAHVRSPKSRLRIGHQPADAQMKNANFEYNDGAGYNVGTNVLRVSCDVGVTEDQMRSALIQNSGTANLVLSSLCQETKGVKAIELLGEDNLGWAASRKYRIMRNVFLVRCVDAAAARCLMGGVFQGLKVGGYPVEVVQYPDEYCVLG